MAQQEGPMSMGAEALPILPPITRQDLEAARFTSGMFGDGRNGAAIQAFRCADFPRLARVWSRESRRDPGRTRWPVDGVEVRNLDETAERLNAPPAPAAQQGPAAQLLDAAAAAERLADQQEEEERQRQA